MDGDDRDEVGTNGDALVPFAVAQDDVEASLITGRLEEAGIGSRLMKESDAAGGFIYKGYDPLAPVAVLVPRSRLSEARSLFGALSPEEAVADDAWEVGEEDGRGTLPQRAFPKLWVWIAAVIILSTFILALARGVLDNITLPL